MSRTTRKSSDEHDHSCYAEAGDCDYLKHTNGREGHEEHAPSWWKRLRRRSQRAKVKDAMRGERQIPLFKKDNDWNWNWF